MQASRLPQNFSCSTDHAPSPGYVAGPGGDKLTVSDIAANIDARARPMSVHVRTSGAVLLRVESGYGTQLQAVRDTQGAVVAVIGPIKADSPRMVVVYSPRSLFDGQSPDAVVSHGFGQRLYPWFTQKVELLETRGSRHAVGSLLVAQPPLDEPPCLILGPSDDVSGTLDMVLCPAPRRIESQSWSVSMETACHGGRLSILVPDSAMAPRTQASPTFTYACEDERMRSFLFKDAAGEVAMRMKPQKLKKSPLALCQGLAVAEGCDAALLVCAVASHVRLETAMRHQLASSPSQQRLAAAHAQRSELGGGA